MVEVGSAEGRNGLRNNLAFYSMGELDAYDRLQRVTLILNVNAESERAKARSELARVAPVIGQRITGHEFPGMVRVIQTGGNRTWRAGAWEVQVKTEPWPTRLGHSVTVYFRPAS